MWREERTATSLARRTLSSREGGNAWYFEVHFENSLVTVKENKRADVARRWSDVRVGEREMTTLSLRARWRPSAECLIKIAMRTLHGNMLE